MREVETQCILLISFALIAQLVEHLICNQGVGSSSLSGGTIFLFPRSSVVEQTTVNRPAIRSNRIEGASLTQSGAVVARLAHNQKVIGSNPISATSFALDLGHAY